MILSRSDCACSVGGGHVRRRGTARCLEALLETHERKSCAFGSNQQDTLPDKEWVSLSTNKLSLPLCPLRFFRERCEATVAAF